MQKVTYRTKDLLLVNPDIYLIKKTITIILTGNRSLTIKAWQTSSKKFARHKKKFRTYPRIT